MTKVYIVNGSSAYREMFTRAGYQVISNFLEAELVCFTGGEDVTPEIYGEENTHSYNNFQRDLQEAGYFAIAKRMGKSMVGICRGGQFLNVMCGGSMVQHVEGHAVGRGHPISVKKKSDYIIDGCWVSSTHHQLMRQGDYGTVVGWANQIKNRDYDPEIIYYSEENALCFQPHPEFAGFDECTELFFELVKDFLL